MHLILKKLRQGKKKSILFAEDTKYTTLYYSFTKLIVSLEN